MTTIRAACAALLLLGACAWEREPMEEAFLTYERLDPREVDARVRGGLSEKGTFEFLGDGRIRIVDFHDNVRRVVNRLETAVHSPFTAVLHFQLIQGTQSGPVDEKLVPIAAALREVGRFRGFELMGQATMSATEGDSERDELEMTNGHEQYIVGFDVTDIRASNTEDGSVELTVRLRRENKSDNMITTNVVVPVGKSVILGRTHPDDTDRAVLLVVRPELDVAEPSGKDHIVELREIPKVDMHVEVLEAHEGELAAHKVEMAKAAVEAARAAVSARLAESLRADCPGGRGCRRQQEQLREARQALIELAMQQLRLELEAGRLTPEQYEKAKRAVQENELAIPTPASTPPPEARRPPPA